MGQFAQLLEDALTGLVLGALEVAKLGMLN